eukprot:2331381-Pyramimonas_sp.AAC.1
MDGNQQCSLTYLFWFTSSRRKHRISLVNRRYAGYVLKLSHRPQQELRPNEGDLVDYHRPATTKDDWGGWNGPFPVVKNDP